MADIYLYTGIGLMILAVLLALIVSVARHYKKSRIKKALREDYGEPERYNIR